MRAVTRKHSYESSSAKIVQKLAEGAENEKCSTPKMATGVIAKKITYFRGNETAGSEIRDNIPHVLSDPRGQYMANHSNCAFCFHQWKNTLIRPCPIAVILPCRRHLQVAEGAVLGPPKAGGVWVARPAPDPLGRLDAGMP